MAENIRKCLKKEQIILCLIIGGVFFQSLYTINFKKHKLTSHIDPSHQNGHFALFFWYLLFVFFLYGQFKVIVSVGNQLSYTKN